MSGVLRSPVVTVSDRLQLPAIAGVTFTGAWFPGKGTTALLADQTGNGNNLVASGALPSLLPTATPAGGPALKWNGGSMSASLLPVVRRGQGYALLAKLTADGQLLTMGGGDWAASISGTGHRVTCGGISFTGESSPGQWQIYMGVCSDDLLVPYTHGLYTSFGSPPVDASSSGLSILSTFAGLFGGLLTFTYTPHTTVMTDAQKMEVVQFLLSQAVWPRRANRVLCHGNSLVGGISTLTGATTWPVLLQKLLGSRAQVQSLAVSAAGTQSLNSLAPWVVDAAADPAINTVLTFWELTNDIVGAGQTGAQAFANYKTYCNARRAAQPHVPIVLFDCIARGGLGGQQAASDTAAAAVNALLAADFTGATSNAAVKTAAAGITYADVLVKASAHAAFDDYDDTTYYLGDKTHLTAAGNAVVAGLVYDAVASYFA